MSTLDTIVEQTQHSWNTKKSDSN